MNAQNVAHHHLSPFFWKESVSFFFPLNRSKAEISLTKKKNSKITQIFASSKKNKNLFQDFKAMQNQILQKPSPETSDDLKSTGVGKKISSSGSSESNNPTPTKPPKEPKQSTPEGRVEEKPKQNMKRSAPTKISKKGVEENESSVTHYQVMPSVTKHDSK